MEKLGNRSPSCTSQHTIWYIPCDKFLPIKFSYSDISLFVCEKNKIQLKNWFDVDIVKNFSIKFELKMI